MARKITTTATPEQRRAQAEALQASIALQVEQLAGTEQWARFLDFAQAFHAYSLNNLLLILSQNPTATHVAGFRKWLQLGRVVRKGERGIRIFGYRQTTIADDTTEAESESDSEDAPARKRTYFPVLSVFDISQTDPIDPDAAELPTISQRLAGEDPAGILAAVTDYLEEAGWTVTREAIPGEANGYATTDGTRRVVIDADLSPAQAAKTGLHEAAHVILEHVDAGQADYIEHRGIRETEAESVAYIVAGIAGLDTAAYSIGYVAGWADGDVETIKSTAARVLRAAHTLADAIAVSEPESEVA